MEQVKKIYFDMDGVLADFERGVKEMCGVIPPSQNSKDFETGADDKMWDEISGIEHFYDKLELMPGAKEMFDAVYGRYGEKCEILTGIPKKKRNIKDAGNDKKKWVRRLLSEDIVVNIVFREDKYCKGKNCILIDDMEQNIREWNDKGGTGILNVNAQSTMSRLREKGIQI